MDGLRKDAARNRALIVEAARALAAQGEPLALNSVARAAGVGVGTVYRHFATVEELEESLVWERFDHLADILEGADPTQLERALTAYFTLLAEDALFEKVVARTAPALEQTRTMRDALVTRLAQLMDRARVRGDLRSGIDAPGVVMLVCGLAYAVRGSGVAADSAQAQALLRVMFNGLRAP